MSIQPEASNAMESEHVVGRALAAEPPLLISALMLAVGAALAVKGIMRMRTRPSRGRLRSWKRFGHA